MKKTEKPVKGEDKKVKDKGAEAVKKAQTPAVKTVATKAETPSSNVIQMFPPPPVAVGASAGGPALASSPAPAPEAEVVDRVKLSEEYVSWKAQESTAKKNYERIQKEIVGSFPTPKDAIGYKNDFLELGENATPDYNHPKLVTLLKEKGVWDKVKKEVTDSEKVKSLAIMDEEIAEMLKDEVVCEPKPRFNQVKKDKEKDAKE